MASPAARMTPPRARHLTLPRRQYSPAPAPLSSRADRLDRAPDLSVQDTGPLWLVLLIALLGVPGNA